jgi:hypothetical protein
MTAVRRRIQAATQLNFILETEHSDKAKFILIQVLVICPSFPKELMR